METWVARNQSDVDTMLAGERPAVVRKWKLSDFPEVPTASDEETMIWGNNQAHDWSNMPMLGSALGGGDHGINLQFPFRPTSSLIFGTGP